MFKCPNCGAGMYYQISTGMLYCENCSSSIAPEDYQLNNEAEERKKLAADGMQEVTVYLCPNCGAELVSPDDSIVSYCIYCGAEHILKSKAEKRRAPQKILPFSYTREECMDSYARTVKHILFLPKEYKSPDYLKKFSGVYVPFYRYEVGVSGSMNIELTKKETSGNRVTETVYNGSVDSTNAPYTVTVDASPALDDTIAGHIEPFDETKEIIYNPVYLAGFYADSPGMDTASYEPEVLNLANHRLYRKLENYRIGGAVISDLPPEKELEGYLNSSVRDVSESLLPIWFLTWRKGSRVAYTVMNGQNGKMAVDLPVDEKRYFGFVLILAALLFIPLYLFLQPTGPVTLAVTMVITAIMMHLFARKIHSLCVRENHVFDPGYRGPTLMSVEKRARIRRGQTVTRHLTKSRLYYFFTKTAYLVFLMIFLFGMVVAVIESWEDMYFLLMSYPAAFLALIAGAVRLIQTLWYLPYLEKKLPPLIQLISFGCLLLSEHVMESRTYRDERYYICCVLCLICCVLTSLAMMQIYNLLNTRPVPSFFTREGGKNGG